MRLFKKTKLRRKKKQNKKQLNKSNSIIIQKNNFKGDSKSKKND